eukprot:TRINITY_DN28166_c0_g1_i7.p3 TRINITY_DN28166_c0_g1~~TRINITY_DN28166_c0_g1_i7.p3  ORF type:complete len:250 (+),score=-10.42 TRINITY_DN28166_c0_g1_i7:2973-3722(+)
MNNCDFLCFSGGVYVEKYGIVIYAIITSLDQLQILYFQSLVERKIRKFDKIYEKDKVKLQKQNCKSQHHKSQHITILIPKNKNSHYLVNIDYNNFPLSIFKQILLQRLLNEQLIGYLPKENQIFANFTSTITLNSQETLDYLRYQQSLQIKKKCIHIPKIILISRGLLFSKLIKIFVNSTSQENKQCFFNRYNTHKSTNNLNCYPLSLHIQIMTNMCQKYTLLWYAYQELYQPKKRDEIEANKKNEKND